MIGFRFSEYTPNEESKSVFDTLLDLFLEIMVHTSGNVDETFDWMEQIDQEHQITTDDYTLDDFRKDLEDKGYLNNNPGKGTSELSGKGERKIRQKALDNIFGKLKRDSGGNHQTSYIGRGDEQTTDKRKYEFGDQLSQIDFTQSIQNAQLRGGIDNFNLQEQDLEVMQSCLLYTSPSPRD